MMKPEMLEARRKIVKVVNDHRIRFNHYLLDHDYKGRGLTIAPVSMKSIQRAVCIARRWNIVDHETLETAGFRGRGLSGKTWGGK